MRIFNIKFSLEINMSMNWIDEKAGEFRAKQELEEQKKHLIKRADYWAELKRQVEKEVEQINKMDVWQEQLKDVPLKIEFLSGSYDITKENFPQVSVSVYNEYDDIEITRQIKIKPESESEERKEIYTVNSDGKKVFLQGDNGILCIPEEAAKHILSPFVKALCGEFSI